MKTLLEQFPLPPANTRRIRLGVIGCGSMFRNCHAVALSILKESGRPLEVVQLCDISREALRAAAQRFPGAECCSDYRRMPVRCDALLIQLWPPEAEKAAARALENGIPFFIEKPVSHNPDVLAELAETARRKKIPVMVGYNRRFQAGAEEFRRLAADMEPERCWECDFFREKRSEAIFYEDILGHPLDFLRYAAGGLEIESVECRPPHRPGGIFSGMRIEAVTPLGRCGLNIRPATGRNVESYECSGNRESVILTYHPLEKLAAPPGLVRHTPGRAEQLCPAAPGFSAEREVLLHHQGFIRQMAGFLRLAGGEGCEACCTPDDALAALKLIRRILDFRPR